jgi:tripartite-type tricarboxylate transporter receptor subunit TctC
MSPLFRAGLIAAVLLAPAAASAADAFAGKNIDLLIGAPPGGGYDIYARTLARHVGRHIPGQPTIVAKNMPGAGSARAAGFISSIAPKDGTAIAAIMPGAVMGPLLDEKGRSAVRSDQGALSRHRQQRHAHLRVAQGFEDQDVRRCAHPEGEVRRRLGQ